MARSANGFGFSFLFKAAPVGHLSRPKIHEDVLQCIPDLCVRISFESRTLSNLIRSNGFSKVRPTQVSLDRLSIYVLLLPLALSRSLQPQGLQQPMSAPRQDSDPFHLSYGFSRDLRPLPRYRPSLHGTPLQRPSLRLQLNRHYCSADNELSCQRASSDLQDRHLP